MPAAAVIPAPLAYTIIVAVKRLVVGLNNYMFRLTLALITHIYFRHCNLIRSMYETYALSDERNIHLFQHCEQIRVYQTCRT